MDNPVRTPGLRPRPATGRGPVLIAQVLVVCLLAVLVGRLWYLQVSMGEHYRALAEGNRIRVVVTPAERGQILDVTGRPLVRNRTELVIAAEPHVLAAQADGGEAVLRRLAETVDVPFEQLHDRVRQCDPEPDHPCWVDASQRPVPLLEGVDPQAGRRLLEHPDEFPGIVAEQTTVRDHPLGAAAATLVGYLQPATEEERRAGENPHVHIRYEGALPVGRDGLELAYDKQLRGEAGRRVLAVDSRGEVTDTVRDTPPRPGAHLVTNIDADVQRIVEKALARGIERARGSGHPADSAAGVVLDVRTGAVVAMASLPSYDPAVWNNGIDQATYNRLLGKHEDSPLISRVIQGQLPPASTFKVVSLAAAVAEGARLDGRYQCPGSLRVGGRAFSNAGGAGHGTIDLRRALVVSCNTVFFDLAHRMWRADGGADPVPRPKDTLPRTARAFGFGEPTGVDLPNEAVGRVPDRHWKRDYWERTRAVSCRRAEKGYPEVAEEDPKRAAELTGIAAEHCAEGYVWRAGDAMNLSIGQGDLLVTPLQVANAYAAIANGGTLYQPRVGRALLEADGSGATRIEPVVAGRLPVSDETLTYLRAALAEVTRSGTAAAAFHGFPQDRIPVAGKTGTASGIGRHDTAWFASYAPADDPRFAVVVVISQGGSGGTTAAPVAREIYEGIYGLSGTRPALPGGVLPAQLPTVRPDGTVRPLDK
ncbi:penicillin-binding protein 2 [Thermobifida cellulosilytica]|uniref:Penicillin-binding protein n=1 Tax=Thermobifida cellulosilytica TB100 TaxID=665004 RepID=A0A147KHB9_THECS|nr:penicillin-binding protein 2 [Thermobifida cellulosilytica]KUP96693.1 penicillin-binding protein [Thermobifida cellulosilytica TB100]